MNASASAAIAIVALATALAQAAQPPSTGGGSSSARRSPPAARGVFNIENVLGKLLRKPQNKSASAPMSQEAAQEANTQAAESDAANTEAAPSSRRTSSTPEAESDSPPRFSIGGERSSPVVHPAQQRPTMAVQDEPAEDDAPLDDISSSDVSSDEIDEPQPEVPSKASASARLRPDDAPTPRSQAEPTPVITARPISAARAPASTTVPKPRQSASHFLADDVRFGPVVRNWPRQEATEPHPPEAVPVNDIQPEQPATARPLRTAPLRTNLRIAPPSLAAQPLEAEDIAPLAGFHAAPSVVTGWGQTGLGDQPVSLEASAKKIMAAVHLYAAPIVPQSAAPPDMTPEGEDSSVQNRPSSSYEQQQPTPAEAGPVTSILEPETVVESAPPSQPRIARKARTPAQGKVLHGNIARINGRTGLIVVDFADQGEPADGSKAQVYRRRLFQRVHIGEVEIYTTPQGELAARTLGRLKTSDLAIKDELTVLPQALPASEPSSDESAPQL